ncbi:hypothetical protein D3C86_1514750 [compost metagenome]
MPGGPVPETVGGLVREQGRPGVGVVLVLVRGAGRQAERRDAGFEPRAEHVGEIQLGDEALLPRVAAHGEAIIRRLALQGGEALRITDRGRAEGGDQATGGRRNAQGLGGKPGGRLRRAIEGAALRIQQVEPEGGRNGGAGLFEGGCGQAFRLEAPDQREHDGPLFVLERVERGG